MGFKRERQPRHVQNSVWLAIGSIALLLTVGACASGGAASIQSGGSKSAFQVDVLASLTGAVGSPGQATAVQAAIDQVNAAGGVNGHQIQVKVLDDQSSTSVAPANATKAIADQPVAIFDTSGSAELAAAMPVLSSAKIPVLSPFALQLGYYPWLYGFGPTPAQQAHGFAGAVESALGTSTLTGKRVDILVLNTPSSEAIGAATKAAIQQEGGTVPETVQQPITAVSFASGAAKVVADHADAITVNGSPQTTVLVAKALVGAGYKGAIVVPYSASDDVTFKTVNSANFFGLRADTNADPGTAMGNAASQYKLTADPNDPEFGLVWGMTYTLTMALKKCGDTCTPSALETALDGLGTYNVPGSDFPYGSLFLSKTVHNVLVKEQLFRWDSSTNSAVKFGPVVDFGPPNY